ncbi:TMV resistance protein N-like [Eucalyptus grandis]|uniref:TMV resistance protein N-like n=1 Tax=Eucalyptus grandis TaxID=71139 RepID=UPI00192EFA5B|nr:TMV resistance protein N-like [Eucalyptus grandis]
MVVNLLAWSERDLVTVEKTCEIMLMRVIKESRNTIIIFSEDYASLWRCLEELAKIMECKAQKKLIVFLVFYKVKPREVRRGRVVCVRAMAKHEPMFGEGFGDSEEMEEGSFQCQ